MCIWFQSLACMQMDCFLKFSDHTLHTVKATQRHPHRHLRSVYITGFHVVVALAEFALYILENATVLENMVVDPVVRMKLYAVQRFYSITKGGGGGSSNSSDQKEYNRTGYYRSERND